MANRRAVIIGAAVAVVLVAAAAVIVVIWKPWASNSPPSSLTTSQTASSESAGTGPALVVKIDNVAEARPQTGLSAADVIYVEPVEGGLTRLAAVFLNAKPQVVGPVRSARESDIELLAQYGQPTLAYSGAAPQLLPLLHSADLVTASPAESDSAYFRDPSRPAPHNLYVHPGQLPIGRPSPNLVLNFGTAPAGGAQATDYQADYQAARYGFHWQNGKWSVSLDGTAMASTEAGPLAPSTVIVQTVQTVPGQGIEDVAGSPSPVVQTVGSGPVTVLRDGRSFTGTWSRPSAQQPTTFTTSAGQQISLAQGQVWILLKPA